MSALGSLHTEQAAESALLGQIPVALADIICQQVADETPVAVQIAQMLDGHLAGHLEQISTIVVKKCKSTAPERLSHVS